MLQMQLLDGTKIKTEGTPQSSGQNKKRVERIPQVELINMSHGQRQKSKIKN